jgi:hypothetical protein
MENLINAAVSSFGRLDVMVNNAGIFTGLHTIVDETEDEYDRTMAVNARSVWLGFKFAIRQMLTHEPVDGSRGRIVNIASIGGLVGLAAEPAYCAAKGAAVNPDPSVGRRLHPPSGSISTRRNWRHLCPAAPWSGGLGDDGLGALGLGKRPAAVASGSDLSLPGDDEVGDGREVAVHATPSGSHAAVVGTQTTARTPLSSPADSRVRRRYLAATSRCKHYASMPHVLVRDVPEDVHAALQRKAERRHQSLQQYLAVELRHLAEQRSISEVLDEVEAQHGGRVGLQAAVADLDEERSRR